MKPHLLKVLFVVLIMGLMSTSCSKDDDESSDNNALGGSFVIKLKIDNANEIKYTKGTAMAMGGSLIIGGNNSDSDIQFSIDPDIVKGTYTKDFIITHGVNGVAVFTTATNATSSSLTITTHDKAKKHLVGTYKVNFTDNNDQSSRTATGSIDITYK
jgi:hypothetical protein